MNSLGSQLWLTFELRIAHMTNIHIIHIHIQLSISTFTDLVHLINRLVRKVVGCRVVASQPEIAAYIHIIHSRTGHATWAKGKLCSPAESTWKLSWDHPLFLEGSSLWSSTLRTSGCPKNSQIFPPAPSFFFLPFGSLWRYLWWRTPASRGRRPSWQRCLDPQNLSEGESCQAVKNGIPVGWPELGP